MGDQTEEPTLGLQTFAQRREVEGCVHSHEGMLAYKSKQRSWKKGWHRVAPGEFFFLQKYLVMQLSTLHTARLARSIAIDRVMLILQPVISQTTHPDYKGLVQDLTLCIHHSAKLVK